MKGTRRFSTRLVRWMSLCVCLSLVLISLVVSPVSLAVRNSSLPQQQGPSNGNPGPVAVPTPQPVAPFPNLPNLDQLRRATPIPVQAPPPIPSTQPRWRGAISARISAPRLMLAKSAPTGSSANRSKRLPLKTSLVKLHHARRNHSTSGEVLSPLPQGSYNFPMARINPLNRTGTGGEDLLSNNFNWSLPLVGLKGRGLDLGLTLSYNSLVWVRSGNYITYDPDDESISPGFRLGFPSWRHLVGADDGRHSVPLQQCERALALRSG
jgi:hypothetical protein